MSSTETKTAQKSKDNLYSSESSNVVKLVLCVSGIYASFLLWGLIQEPLTTSRFGPEQRLFQAPVVTNSVQNLFAFVAGYCYLTYKSHKPSSLFNMGLVRKLLFVSATTSLSSPLAQYSLEHVGYLTFMLAKSCKLIPVMLVSLLVYRQKFPAYKYAVALSVTIGVAVFTMGGLKKKATSSEGNFILGAAYLLTSLVLDGLTNSTQDQLLRSDKSVTGAHLMCGINMVAFVANVSYGLLRGQFPYAIQFITENPVVLQYILGYSICGALGQVFIFYTLEQFSSVVLVTVTVTRKMISMFMSIVVFGHQLKPMQWLGMAIVFCGIGYESLIKLQAKPKMA